MNRTMRAVPECMSRRYQALDDLIRELSSEAQRDSDSARKDPSIKLMCQFWNILKEDPDCNLSEAVQQRMCKDGGSGYYYPQHVTCYMAEEDSTKAKADEEKCCKSIECEPAKEPSATSAADNDKMPLAQILCNIKDAASYDQKCGTRLNELLQTEKKLQAQIQVLEKREKNGAQLLKQADCMWTCMEEAYKKKVAESLERQKELLGELKDVEKSAAKWRKHKKELESQLKHIAKCQEEINEKINQKTNDMNCMDKEMDGFRKRIDSNKKDTENIKKALSKRRADSDTKMKNITKQLKKLQTSLVDENKIKAEKESEGNQYIKEAREDLQKICKVLLQKKLENEDLTAEKDALLLEIEILKQTGEQCKDKCKSKRESIEEQIKKCQEEIEGFQIRCIRCHECTDTDDVRKFCTDCPQCVEERECIYAGDHCSPDHTMDCVCQSVKQKFLDNVFDNMYTVLERQTKTGTGKAVAEAVLDCLKRSRNGKLNEETRKILQEFILTTVKKNLNLTIVGGAVKTRCEMENETYQQLMACLQKIKATRPPKEDKGTNSKKESCRRWGGPSECNCPKGPKACICTKKAPPPPDDPSPCPPQDKEDAGAVVTCPNKKNTSCGPDCGAHSVPSMVGADPAKYRPNPCEAPSCAFKNNMRAAQCVLGPESIASSQNHKTALPCIPYVSVLQDQITCKCGSLPTKPCTCKKDCRSQPRQRMIEEVMGRYLEVIPIEKVTTMDGTGSPDSKMPGKSNDERCVCAINHPQTSKASKNKVSHFHSCLKDGLQEKLVDQSVCFCSKHGIFKCTSNKNAPLIDPHKTEYKHQNVLVDNSLETIHKISSFDFSFTNNIDQYSTNSEIVLFGKEVNETVKALVKDIIVPDITSKYNMLNGTVEWVTVEALLNEIVSLSKTTTAHVESNETVNEIEMTNDSYELNRQEKLQKETVLDPKQLKAGITKVCNKDSCDMTWDAMEDNVYRKSKNLYVKGATLDKNRVVKIPSVQAEVFSKSLKHNGTKPLITRGKEKRAKTKEAKQDKIKVAIGCDCSLSDIDDNSVLFNKSSGSYTIELDEKVVDKIHEQTRKTSSMFVALKETKSGNYLIDFNRTEKDSSDQCTFQQVLVKRTTSGNLSLEVDKSILNTFQLGNEPSQSTVSVGVIKRTDVIKKICKTNFEQRTYMNKNSIRSILEDKILDIKKQQWHSNEFSRQENPIIYDKSSVDDMKKDTFEMWKPVYNEPYTLKDQTVNIKNGKSSSKEFTSQEKPITYDKSSIDEINKESMVSRKGTYHDGGSSPSKSNYSIPTDSSIGVGSTFEIRSLYEIQSIEDFKADINNIYNQRTEQIKIKIEGANGVITDAEAKITKTSSGNLAIKLIDMVSIGKLSQKAKERPVLTKRSPSGTYTICLGGENLTKVPNTFLRRTPSNGALVVIAEPMAKSIASEIKLHDHHHEKKEKFKVKANNLDNLIEPPALLQLTSSGNYVLILDREFEKHHIQNIANALGSDNHCYVEIQKTRSETLIIKLEENNEMSHKQNALLYRTETNNIKLLVNSPILKNLPRSRSLASINSIKSKALEDFIKRASAKRFYKRNFEIGVRSFQNQFIKKPRVAMLKASSDSNLYKKDNLRIQSTKSLLAGTSAILKKTNSGQYAIVLSKDSKTTFVNDLKNFLSSSSHGRIPIWRELDSGEITIALSGNDASLKITSSGNIYILVNDSVIKSITKDIEDDREAANKVLKYLIGKHDETSNTGTGSILGSRHYIKKIQNPENKAVATNCNAKPDDSTCDASKCICSESHCETNETFVQCAMNLLLGKISPCLHECTEACSSTNTKPHIVIKPCGCRQALNKCKEYQCYNNVTASVCPVHKDRYENVSNEILEISGLCNKMEDNASKNVLTADSFHESVSWDSLSFLPPQLPEFLRDYHCRN